ncbi:SRPBCC domain-containing protein [Parahaliea maris]|uniref:SRPBCC domain-containing protein n=1 Tax=Parahaliea maris TaxID=2716870 RepID=A0A5C9A8X8_9GAMM|nr:SRPBCC domain-containing protein [Parahaliea maris]TXS96494.1 SRPBCC domain-containing protein [Parahaliea maris]
MYATRLALALFSLCIAALPRAEVVSASDSHFVVRQQAHSSLPADALWERLVHPARWWNPAHSYSGEATALSLEPRAGGLWLEEWPGGSVAHGQVITIMPGKLLRLDAPFGPLQSLGAHTVWTISLAAAEGGTTVTFHETAVAPPGSGMEAIAAAVDQVKTEAIGRLVAP